jgi:ribosomal protein S18 acetylase RimI-like enzyme
MLPFMIRRRRIPMSEAIAITSARRDDVPEIQRLAHEIWHAHYPGIITTEQIDYMLERGYATRALEALVAGPASGIELALADGRRVGFAAWYATDTPGEAKLDKLYVLQAYQRRGAGALLIARVEDGARAAGASTLVLNVNKQNAQAVAAYRKHGFAIREAVEVDIGNGFVMDDYVMAKPIAR